jgi:hypothetical protein
MREQNKRKKEEVCRKKKEEEEEEEKEEKGEEKQKEEEEKDFCRKNSPRGTCDAKSTSMGIFSSKIKMKKELAKLLLMSSKAQRAFFMQPHY